jgi:hypothetical protein
MRASPFLSRIVFASTHVLTLSATVFLVGTIEKTQAQTPLPLPVPAVVRIHAGGAASGIWSAEQYLAPGGRSTVVTTGSVVNPGLDLHPAPQTVYQVARAGVSTYTIPGLKTGLTYPVRLHFAEIQTEAVGGRQFNVLINGVTALSNFDIVAASGGEFVALERTFLVAASASGTISLQFESGSAGVPLINGIEVLPPVLEAAEISAGNSGLGGILPILGGLLGQTPAATQAIPTIDSAVYNIIADATGISLDDDNTTNPGTDVIQWTSSATNTNQQWQINELPDGSYALISLSNGLALDSSSSVAVQTLTSPTQPTSTQLWHITRQASGDFTLSNVQSGKYLDSGSQASSGAGVSLQAKSGAISQNWKLVPVQIGAATPFRSYEAEDGVLIAGAHVISETVAPSTGLSSAAIEASGRAYVHLAGAGQAVQIKNKATQAITAINVRYSIPDAPAGGGISATLGLYINGALRQTLPVNSKQTWFYETAQNYDSFDKNPQDGTAHVYWDEVHTFIQGAPVQPGDVVELRMDSQSTAPFYDIDVLDLETPSAPLSQPANSLSITDYGAIANDPAVDNTGYIRNCIAAAQLNGKSVWIPQGTFYIQDELQPVNITMQGAGMWYSVIFMNQNGPNQDPNVFNPTSTKMFDFAIDSNIPSSAVTRYGINMNGNNWVIQRVWLSHVGASIWAQGTGGQVLDNRINNSWADGININNGSGAPGFGTGNYLTVDNNFVRGSGDDGISINDAGSNPAVSNGVFSQMIAPTVTHNTSVAPWWANCIGVYGGVGILVANNVTNSGAKENGIGIGPFGGIGGPFQSGDVQGNLVLHGGSMGGWQLHPGIYLGVLAVWNYDPTVEQNLLLRGNLIVDSVFDGLQIGSLENTLLSNDVVESPGHNGIEIDPLTRGNASLYGDTVENVAPGFVPFLSNSPAFQASGGNNTGFNLQ